jgi:hypothetical protein
MSRVALVPVLVLAVCTLPVATAAWWGAPLLLVPLLVAVWVLRVGEDQELWLVRRTGTEVRLPVVRARDLPRLAAVSDGRIPDVG